MQRRHVECSRAWLAYHSTHLLAFSLRRGTGVLLSGGGGSCGGFVIFGHSITTVGVAKGLISRFLPRGATPKRPRCRLRVCVHLFCAVNTFGDGDDKHPRVHALLFHLFKSMISSLRLVVTKSPLFFLGVVIEQTRPGCSGAHLERSQKGKHISLPCAKRACSQ